MAKINNQKNLQYNLFSILALVFTFIFYPIGLIFGLVALNQIKETNEKGKWMALVPVWVGAIIVAFILFGVIWALFLPAN